MRFCVLIVFLMSVICHVAFAHPLAISEGGGDDQMEPPRYAWKRANNPQELAMARLQMLLGPEAFTEMDSHGRLSNLQRLG